MPCSTGCPTQDHESWGACLRAKSLRTAVSIPGLDWDRSRQKDWDKRIDSYREARDQGIQPASSRSSDIDTAVKVSDATGTAYRAS